MKIPFSYLWEGGATEESDTKRDGFLSYSAEWHAAVSGFRKGLMGMKPTPEQPDSKEEKRYFNWFHTFGRLVSVAIAAVAGGSFL